MSCDGAHATHPNYPERHDADHPVVVNGGPVIKHNANVRYATDADTAAWFALACAGRSRCPVQHFVSRDDMPCGSTIGPITAARLGIRTVDVGVGPAGHALGPRAVRLGRPGPAGAGAHRRSDHRRLTVRGGSRKAQAARPEPLDR